MVKVAIIQQPPVFLNITQSMAKAGALIQEAAGHGAHIIAFPETWLCGYPVWLDASPKAALWNHPPAQALYQILADNAIVIPGPRLDQLRALAHRTGVYVVMGAHERQGGTLYNTTLYIGTDGDSYQLHRKLMPTYTERLIWGQGDGSTLSVLDTEYGVLGGLICWEHWMPLARAAMHAKRETIHIAQWPSVKELHQIASRHYAFEGQCFVLAAGCVLSRGDVLAGFSSLGLESEARELLHALPGDEHTLLMRGGSAVIAPNVDYLAGPVFDEACTLYADLDLDRITRGHLALDSDGHYARPDVFHLDVNDHPQSNVTFASERVSPIRFRQGQLMDGG